MTNHSPAVVRTVSGCMNGMPVRRFMLLLAALVSVSAYPSVFVYCHNIGEAVFAQVFPPILIFAAVGLAAWLIFGLLSATMSKGACTTLIFLLIFINYSRIEDGIRSLAPDWRWWRIAPAFLFLLINLALMLRVVVKRSQGDAACTKIAVIIGSVFLALTIFNAANGLYTLSGTPRVKSNSAAISDPPAGELPPVSSAGKRPNFYVFIFDEYSRQDVLKKYTGYDNTPFLQRLESKKFNVSYSSYSTADSTNIAIANLWHYSVHYKTPAEASQAFQHAPPLFLLFKKAGYKIYGSSWIADTINRDVIDVTLESTTVLTALSIEKTVLGQSFLAYVDQSGNEAIRADRLRLLQQAARIIEEPSEKPKFMYFHLLLPHGPFVFDEKGDPVAYENIENALDTKYYTGQLRFLSKKIDELADTILKKDPHAVVLMQSDHGARFFSGMQYKEKLACLNIFYVGGQAANIEGLSTIKTLRLALNHALGLKLNLEGHEP